MNERALEEVDHSQPAKLSSIYMDLANIDIDEMEDSFILRLPKV